MSNKSIRASGQTNIIDAQRYVISRGMLNGMFDIATAIKPETIPLKWMAQWTLDRLRQEQMERIAEREKSRNIQALDNQARNEYQKDFIDQFILLGEGNSNANFDQAAQKLSRVSQFGELTDIYLRLIKMAGFDKLIIFIDEFEQAYVDSEERPETFIARNSDHSASILNLFFKLHTRMADQAGDFYPSTMQIMVMPDYLHRDVIRKVDPGLHERWRVHGEDDQHKPLTIIAEHGPASNSLVQMLTRLFREAGIPIRFDPDDSQQIARLKRLVYLELLDNNPQPLPATMRHLIPRLIEQIKIYPHE